ALGAPIGSAIIGRPVNFQGPAGSVENDQALAMLRSAAHMAGFARVDFLYEPLAAAFEYEASLNTDQTVLVVDVGGGTTDCSLVQVGPARRLRQDRGPDMCGHSGERVGGNDYDQALALAAVVPHLGWQAPLRSGLPVPNHYLVDAVTTNDVNAQARFYSEQTLQRLQELQQECLQPLGLTRLLKLQRTRGSYRLLRAVETTKIQLSQTDMAKLDLDFVDPGLQLETHRGQFSRAASKLLTRLEQTLALVNKQAAQRADLVYLTGGMAQAPVVRDRVQSLLGTLPVLDSDHFTSVTEGLTLWAATQFGV
ncbi:MAG: molecular chaperone, partial [Pseudomonadales bacterium]